MTSFAEFSDVAARAGVVANAWTQNADPSDTDIEKLIAQVSGEIAGFIAGAGYDPDALDQRAMDALVSVTADFALLLAIDATFPGDRSGVSELRQSVQDRVDAYRKSMEAGNVAALLYLGTNAEQINTGGAADFWTAEGEQDYLWSLWSPSLRHLTIDPFGVAPSQGPAFRKGMRL